MELMKPPQTDDPTQKNTLLVFKFLPFMIGYFSLSVPSGLSIYWFTNNVLSTAQRTVQPGKREKGLLRELYPDEAPTVESIVLSIISMLSGPNHESPSNVEAAINPFQFIMSLVTSIYGGTNFSSVDLIQCGVKLIKEIPCLVEDLEKSWWWITSDFAN
nr:inner membrane protein albino3, chloroplastic [Quercus suber]